MSDENVQKILQPVILAGGSGSRLWPLSRQMYPKQLLNLVGNRTMLQDTILRAVNIPGAVMPMIVVGKEQNFLVKDQCAELNLPVSPYIVLEPLPRSTAPAIAAAALLSRNISGDDAVLLVLPADHLIKNIPAFHEAVAQAMDMALKGDLVTLGIKADRPETGYGYIKKGEGFKVSAFIEKPDIAAAERYVKEGNYYWNSGMFAFLISRFLEEMEKHAPDILRQAELSVARSENDDGFIHLDLEAFNNCRSESIDYALMERSDCVAVVPADLGWSDVGSWAALYEVLNKDTRGNAVHGDVILKGVTNSLVRSEGRLVAAIGLENILVVETHDAVLVAPLDRSQEVRKIVPDLKAANRQEYLLHQTAHRPWGTYTVLEEHPGFKIKRITVKPGARLSLQMHHHRSEHWIAVRGTARVTRGEEVFLLRENESTYIPAGEKHRLENPGIITLELIEVQNGSYLGEDDIIRFDDQYGRLSKS